MRTVVHIYHMSVVEERVASPTFSPSKLNKTFDMQMPKHPDSQNSPKPVWSGGPFPIVMPRSRQREPCHSKRCAIVMFLPKCVPGMMEMGFRESSNGRISTIFSSESLQFSHGILKLELIFMLNLAFFPGLRGPNSDALCRSHSSAQL